MKNNNRYLPIVLIAITLFFVFAGCSDKKPRPDDEKSMPLSGIGGAANLTWNIPEGWLVGSERSMRIATYIIKPVDGDKDSAECAVFYFGSTSGGGIEDNIRRWVGQFEQPDGGDSMEKAIIDSLIVNDVIITTIDLKGTYSASGAMMQIKDKKPEYRLLGAIVQGPEGLVFFKLTGPQKTADSAKNSFMALLKSIKPRLV
jgi:hypothetical protein